MNLVGMVDLVGFFAILMAVVIVLRGWRHALGRNVKLLLVGLLAVTLFHSLSNTLEWSGITKCVDPFEDFIQILEPMLWGFFFHSFLLTVQITDHKQAEDALRETRAELRSIFTAAPIGIGLVVNRILKEVNDRICEMTGRSREELLEQSARMLYPTNEDYEYVGREKYAQIRERGIGTVETRWRRRNGEVIDVLMSSTPLDPDDLSAGVTFTALDITERKQAEQELENHHERLEELVAERTKELEDSNKKLAAANKELEGFSYSVSHDLRAPARHMQGFAKMLKDEIGAGVSEQAEHYIDVIVNGSETMSSVIEALLRFSRLSRVELNRARVDSHQVVEGALKELEPDIKGRKIEWKIGKMPHIECDHSLFRQVFANLISNAVKYTSNRDEAVIEIGSYVGDDDYVVYYVRDNGVGFDMEYVDKLFGLFQRLHSDDEFKGTGIGLALVRRIVERHGGTTWGEGEVGKGATVYFSMPS